MDLPTCPSCGQSVLDEGADTCPFCGKAMKGGPGRGSVKPAPRVSAPGEKPSGVPSSKGPAPGSATVAGNAGASQQQSGGPAPRPRRPIGQTIADDENPFELELEETAEAIPIAPRRTAGRPYQVVCPMCETAGFVPVAAAGKNVRCANPKCMVPVFKAPRIPKKDPTALRGAEESGSSTTWIILGVAALMLIAGAGTWYVLGHRGESLAGKSGGKSRLIDRGKNGTTEAKSGNGDEGTDGNTTEPSTEQKPVVLADVQERVFGLMVTAAQIPNQNRSKPFCRQLTAETYAACGDIENARAQLERLRDVGRNVPYYEVMPLVAIGWQELKAGNLDSANKTLDEATKAAVLPQFGIESLNIATAFATVLAAAGRSDEARAVLKNRAEAGMLGEMAAAWRAAFDSETFDFDAIFAETAMEGVVPPQRAAVARGLTLRGYADAARQWAEQGDSLEVRIDCTVAWAETLAEQAVRRKQPDLLAGGVESATAPLGAAGKARVYARLAVGSHIAGDVAQAEKSLAVAREAIGSVKEPAPASFPDMKGIYGLKLADPANLRQAALASAEIARVEKKLEHSDAAWTSISRAMTYLRGTTPSPSAAKATLDEIEKVGPAAMREMLKKSLGLRNDDEAFRAAITYRQNCTVLFEASDARFKMQTQILQAAVDWGLRDDVWNEIRTAQNVKNKAIQEPWFESPLPSVLAARFTEAGEADKAAAVVAAVGKKEEKQEQEAEARIKLQQTTSELLAAGKFTNAAIEIESFRSIQKIWRLRLSLQTVSQLIKSGKTAQALEFTAGFEEILVREAILEAAGALAARRGDGQVILEHIEQLSLTPTEQVSLCRGFLLGLLALEHEQTP